MKKNKDGTDIGLTENKNNLIKKELLQPLAAWRNTK
jgi:hypothetical protein